MNVVSLGGIWNEELATLLAPELKLRVVDPEDVAQRDAALRDADVVITGRFTREMGAACKRLRLLICPPAGTENIDRAALPRGATFVNGEGHEIPIAEYVIGSIVALRQHLLLSDRALRRGEWAHGFNANDGVSEELYGSNLGMVGFGRIGQAVSPRARSFGMQCAAVTLHPETPRQGAADLTFLGKLSQSDVDRLVAWSDQLVLCCELSELTKGLLDARRFGLMKPTAVVVNVARGPIAVEADLYEALASKRIAGAAIDVWYKYPKAPGTPQAPSDLPFHALDNVIMTPHASGWTEPTKRRRLAAIVQTIVNFARDGSGE